MRVLFTPLFALFICFNVLAETGDTQPPMSNARLEQLIMLVDSKADGREGNWSLSYEGFRVRVITDERADRMRIIIGITRTEDMNKEELYRMLQANFDTALDARYSIAKGVVWSAFIHPLSDLSDNEFLSGLAQTINLASSYGENYSSGALRFGGGDSEAEEQRRYRDLTSKGQRI